MNTLNDSLFQNSLNELKTLMNDDPIPLNQVKFQIDRLMKTSGKVEYDYLNALLHPETERGVKIPSQIPIPSTTFHLKASCDLKTNELGNLFGNLHPWFLADDSYKGQHVVWEWGVSNKQRQVHKEEDEKEGQSQSIKLEEKEEDIEEIMSKHLVPRGLGEPEKLEQKLQEGYLVRGMTTLFFTNSEDLNGTTQIDDFDNIGQIDINQCVPAGVYDSYRLVSASMRIIYTGPLDEAAGVIGGAIVLGDKKNSVGCQCQLNVYQPEAPTFDSQGYGFEYTVFNRLRYAPYFRENSILEGLRMLYFPLDNKSTEFCPLVGYGRTFAHECFAGANRPELASDFMRDFGWFFYVQGGPKRKSFRLELDCNFEVMPSAKLMNYMPLYISPEYIKPAIMKKIYQEVMNKAIGKCTCHR